MGLSHVIPAGVVFIPIFFIVTTIPGISNTILQINEAAVDVSEVEEDILNTHFEISNLQSTGLNNRIFFDVTNTGTTKLWDYENFDLIITYEGVVNAVVTNVTEKFTYSEIGPTGDPILFDAVTSWDGFCLVLTGCATFDHTVTNSGANRILIVGISHQSAADITRVRYNNVDLTEIRSDTNGQPGSYASLWYLVNPSTGTHPVKINVGLLGTNLVAGAVSFTGVDQTNPINTHNGASGNSASPSVLLTTNADEAWLVDVLASAGGTSSPGAGQVERWEITRGGVTGTGSTEFTSASGTFSMSWTIDGGANNWAISAAALKPDAIPCCVSIGNWNINNIVNDSFDPGIINNGETASVRVKTSYQIITNGDVHVTLSAENGAKATSFATSS